MSIRKVAWVFASAAVLIGIGSLIWSSRGTILISEVVASCREDATRVCASEVAEGGGSGIDLEDITRYDGGSTGDATRETNRTIIVDCLRRHEHLLHHICRYNLVSYDNSRDDKYSHTREHQRQYIVPIIVCMYSLIPTAVLIYSLYMTVRIHQLQSTAIRLNRGNRGSEAEDGQGCSADIATMATDASCNNRIETIGFHNVDCVQGGILFELMAGTMNVIIKHDDGEGDAAAVRVLSQLAGRAIEIGSSAVVHTVNSRLMSSSDYHYVMSSQHGCRWMHPDDCRHLWECGLTLWQTIVHYALLGASGCSLSQNAALSQAYRLMVDLELESKADRLFDRSSPSPLEHLDALKTQIAIHVLSNTPLLLIVDDPFLGLDGPHDDQSGELVRVLGHIARTYGTIVVLVLSFHRRHRHRLHRVRRRIPSSMIGGVHNMLAMGRDGRMIFSGSITDMTAFMSEPSTSSIIAEKMNIDRRYLNSDSEYLEAVLQRLGEGTTDHSTDEDEDEDADDDDNEDGLSMRLLHVDHGAAVPSSSYDLSADLCDRFDRSSFRQSSLQTIGRFDRTQARELLLGASTSTAAIQRHWLELLCILLSRALHSDFSCSLLRRSHALYFVFVFGASLLHRIGFPSSSSSLPVSETIHPKDDAVLFILVVCSFLFQAMLIILREKSESALAVHDLAKGFVSSAWPFVLCVSLTDVLHAFLHSCTLLICSTSLLLSNTIEVDTSLSQQMPTDRFLVALMGGILTWRSCVFYMSLALHDSSASLVVITCVSIAAAVCSSVVLPLSGAIFHPITTLLSFWCIVCCKMGSAHSIHHRSVDLHRDAACIQFV